MRIAIFDSGLGGLSIFSAIKAQLPTLGVDYVSDNAAFPYGGKSEDELIARVDQVLHYLEQRLQPELIVVACNTASTVALPIIRETLDCAVVGVVPAIKPAALLSQNKVIALLATPGTVARPYTQQLITDFAADCEVLKLGSSRLVEIAEQKLQGQPVHMNELRALLEPLRCDPLSQQLDCVVLGCTHFPLLSTELREALGLTVDWVDSGAAIAERVKQLLGTHLDSLGTHHHTAWFTKMLTPYSRHSTNSDTAGAGTELRKTILENGFSELNSLVI